MNESEALAALREATGEDYWMRPCRCASNCGMAFGPDGVAWKALAEDSERARSSAALVAAWRSLAGIAAILIAYKLHAEDAPDAQEVTEEQSQIVSLALTMAEVGVEFADDFKERAREGVRHGG